MASYLSLKPGFAAFLALALGFCVLILPGQCKITSLNNKYSQWQTLRSIEMPDHDVAEIKPNLHKIVKRQEKVGQNKVLIARSILEASQGSNHAFVHWIGKSSSDKVIVLTCQFNTSSGMKTVIKSQLWRSDDYGVHFSQVKTIPDSKLSYFYTFPTNRKKLLFTDVKAKKVYTTVDEMETDLAMHEVPVEPDFVLPHPSDEDQILIYSLAKRELYVTFDFAKTWSLLSENVLPKFYWGIEGYDDPNIVHMEIEGSSPDKAEYKACHSKNCKDTAGEGYLGPFIANTLFIYKEYIFVQKPNLNGSDTYLMVSYKRQPFEMAYFPGNVKTHDFLLLNLDDGEVFIAVIHETSINLYLSDATGHFYVLSFSDVYHMIQPYMLEIDLHEVQGMNWTFIVNKRVANIPNGVQSYISFDKGGNWGPIPLTKELKKQCKADDCYLQLNLKPSRIFTHIVSSTNAPGIVIAHGTLISATAKQPSAVSVFTSRDGGWTWKKAPFTGSYNLNILDQGSVLTAIPDGTFSLNKSNTLYFSCDEGDTWTNELYDNANYMVNGVLTEPGILTLTELIFGLEGRNQPWVLIRLNFSLVVEKKCEAGDYESWFPQDFNDVTQNNCTMGRRIEYQRRKKMASCHNGETLIPRILSNDTCECTREDYECDFGYEEVKSKCVSAKWYSEGYLPVKCNQGEKYMKSQGFRKVSSDACLESDTDKKSYGKQSSPCQVVKPHGLSIAVHSLNIALGKEVSFYLNQLGGSINDTTYIWNLGDGSVPKTFHDLESAKQLKYTYSLSGHFKVVVTAQNDKGNTLAFLMVHVQDRLSEMTLLTPLTGKAGFPIIMSVLVLSQSLTFKQGLDHIHFVWSFGDEDVTARPMLTWDQNVTHTYKQKGTYRLSVEAVNSIGSLYKQFEMQIFEDAEILVLTVEGSGFISITNPFLSLQLLRQLRYQLSDDLSLDLNRIETMVEPENSQVALLYVYSSEDPKAESMDSIKKRVIDLVKRGFGFNLFGKRNEGGILIRITTAAPYSGPSSDNSKNSPNLRAIFIGVPVLFLALVVTIILLCYCRRKHHHNHQYNMLHMQDDSDALLDDEDEAPLDLNIEFRGRDSHRDDPILNSGGSHLVMQDNLENC